MGLPAIGIIHYTLGVHLPLILWYVSKLMLSVNILIFPLQWFEQIRQDINCKKPKESNLYQSFSYFFCFLEHFQTSLSFRWIYLLAKTHVQQHWENVFSFILAEKWKTCDFFILFIWQMDFHFASSKQLAFLTEISKDLFLFWRNLKRVHCTHFRQKLMEIKYIWYFNL